MDSQISHVRQLSLTSATALIQRVNPKLAAALHGLVRAEKILAKQRPKSPRLSVASYKYGQLLMGSRASSVKADLVGRFLTPCHDDVSACGDCKALAAEVGNVRPLVIILNHAVEEFLEDAELPGSARTRLRFSPTRLLAPGQILGLSEALNALVDPSYQKQTFRAPIRKASAGMRSAYVTVPVGNKELKRALRKMLPASQSGEPDEHIWDSEWEDWHFLRAASRVAIADSKTSWDVQVVVIPLAWLRSNVYSQGEVVPAARNFLLQLYEMAWKESRGLRSESIRQLTLSEAARGIHGSTNADLIVQRLLLILRGDAPGFRPAAFSEERVPMNAIWQLLLGTESIRGKFFADRFPAIVEPFHLDRREELPPGAFFYYPLTSFEQFGHSGSPEDEIETMEKLDKLLKQIKSENPELLGRVHWQFCASPVPVKDQTGRERPRNTSVAFCSAHSSEVIKADFAGQLQSAAKFLPAPSTTLLSEPPRKGFLRRFIRVSLD